MEELSGVTMKNWKVPILPHVCKVSDASIMRQETTSVKCFLAGKPDWLWQSENLLHFLQSNYHAAISHSS